MTGKCSTFGGPDDHGVGLTEGLALVQPVDLAQRWFARLFTLPLRTGFGLARSLNPAEFYCAMRWDQVCPNISYAIIRRSMIRVRANGRIAYVQPIDYGPGDGSVVDGETTPDTGRIIDLSPGSTNYLGAATDDVVEVDLPIELAGGAS